MSFQIEQRGESIVPGQMPLGLLNTRLPAERILERAHLAGLSLEFALRVQEVGGYLGDDLRVLSLTFWKPGCRGAFVETLPGFIDASRKEAWAMLERIKAMGRSEDVIGSAAETASRLEEAEIIPEMVQQAPAEWSKLVGALTPSELALLKNLNIIQSPFSAIKYVLHPNLFEETIGDLRRENPEEIDFEDRDPLISAIVKQGKAKDAFRAVVFKRHSLQLGL